MFSVMDNSSSITDVTKLGNKVGSHFRILEWLSPNLVTLENKSSFDYVWTSIYDISIISVFV